MNNNQHYFHIQVRVPGRTPFYSRAEKFAFLNIWRTYFQEKLQTCAYTILPDRFECVAVSGEFVSGDIERVKNFIRKTLLTKMAGVWADEDIEACCGSIHIAPLYTEKDCIYKIFDIHTLPQKKGITTDYRTYPFSSYQALSSVRTTLLAKQLVWEWFGGRMRFAAFHQAYACWPADTVALAG